MKVLILKMKMFRTMMENRVARRRLKRFENMKDR